MLAEELAAPERAPLEAHVERCPHCKGILEHLTDASHLLPLAPSARVQAQSVDPNRTTDTQSGGAGEPLALDFLAPPGRPDALGRLGHYEVLQVLGLGGFGIVFRAYDDVLQRVVAIKVLSPAMAATSPARKRFLREARAAAQVCHENVVQIYAVEEQPLPFLVMEFLPGETLQQRLERIGPFETADVVAIGRQVAEGLTAAHAVGLIHRDIKPANILVEAGARLRVKISDFGLARAADDASLTRSGTVSGTPLYMSPEQAGGESLDHRTDLFSLGSVLYTITAGHPPFRAGNSLAVLKRVAEQTPRPIAEIVPETPAWLYELIAKLHAKDPQDRIQTAAEVADFFAQCQAGVKPVIPRDASRQSRGAWSGWVSLGAIAACLLLLGGLGLSIVYKLRPHPQVSGEGNEATAVVDLTKTSPPPLWIDPKKQLPTPEELAARPSPLDALRREGIPEEVLARAGVGNPDLAPAELVAVLGGPEGHTEFVYSAAFSPDGTLLASAGYTDGTVRLWDTATGRRLRTWTGHAGKIHGLAFRPDGKAVASAAQDGKIRLWDPGADTVMREFTHTTMPSGEWFGIFVAFTPDGGTLASGGFDNRVVLWDPDTGQARTTYETSDTVWSLAFSPGGKSLAAGCEGSIIHRWEVASRREFDVLHCASGSGVRSLAFHPNGRLLANGCQWGNGSVWIWDLETERVVHELKGHQDMVMSCAWRADGRLLATAALTDSAVRLWDVTADPPRSKVIPIRAGAPHGLAFSPEGRYLAVTTNYSIYILRLAEPGQVFQVP
jgi:serine/threonine protein kinase/DNA-binding beta-propeller fold protein YncE